jgi:hypothetical protein
VEAQRQAFYAAKELARSEAEARVREEYDKNESLGPGTKRMKWDAKIRMQQVKLRTKGLSLNRTETVRYMIDSTVNKALKKVEKQFQEMEQERGFKMTERERLEMKEAEDKRLAYLRELEDARREAEEKAKAEAALALQAEKDAELGEELDLCSALSAATWISFVVLLPNRSYTFRMLSFRNEYSKSTSSFTRSPSLDLMLRVGPCWSACLPSPASRMRTKVRG